MPAIAKIRSYASNLTKAEQQVVTFLLANAEEIPFLSIQKISEAARVSISTVSRLAPKLGYASLHELKIDLAQESSSTSISAIYQEVRPRDGDDEIVRKVFGGYIKSFQDTMALLDLPAFIDIAHRIASSRRVAFFGIGGSGNIAQEAALCFAHLDL